MALSDEDIREILRIVDESDLDELRIDTDGFSLHVRKGGAAAAAAPVALPATDPPPAANPPPVAARAREAEDVVVVPSPLLGTFYRAEAPGAAPFVEVGARIEPDSTVCIIEVMKMMNSVPAGISGTVVEVCAENGELVEYGEPLIRVKAP